VGKEAVPPVEYCFMIKIAAQAGPHRVLHCHGVFSICQTHTFAVIYDKLQHKDNSILTFIPSSKVRDFHSDQCCLVSEPLTVDPNLIVLYF
jgi:hypothetical protein